MSPADKPPWEDVLEDAQVYLRIVEQATDLIYLLDPTLRVIWLNPHSAEVFGELLRKKVLAGREGELAPEQRQRFFIGRQLDGLFRTADASFLRRKVAEVQSGGTSVAYEHSVTTSRRRYYFSTKLIPITDEQGEAQQILGITRDVTDKWELDQRIYNAEKLASIGILAAGVAHEINNPLAVILGFTELMLERFPPGQPEHDDLKIIEYNANHAKEVVEQMLGFARVTEGRRQTTDLIESLQTVTSIVAHALRSKKIELSLDLPGKLPLVRGDPRELQQVIFNLLTNAVAAMPEGGRIAISAWQLEDSVEVAVRDTGSGIPDEVKPRVFDPFFTTKRVGEGTGLGLSLCYGIVTKVGGRIRFSSAAAGETADGATGTTFIVSLPIVSAPAPRRDP